MDLFKLRAVLGLDTSEYERGLKNSSNLFSKAAGGITKTATAVGKAVAVGLGAAATAVGALVKQSVEAFADYEQLVGGVETLFGAGGQSLEEYADAISKSTDSVKEFQKANGLAVNGIIGPETLAAIERSYKSLGKAQTTVLNDASKAYKTAGLSANAYMETVTGFSAALISSLGGDTETAAKYANQAIIDMSDNANKMGTDIESIQYAYQGFAKQNYTMLDNLKLGYGGTKTEMERLLKDAEKLTGKKFDISNFADITEAIHAIQTEMGITGTTAKEASTTISGSIASMKASWQNMLVAISSDDLPFDEYVKNFADSVATVADNLIPRIGTALQGVGTLVAQLAPIIAEQLPGLVEQLLPSLITAAAALLDGVIAALPSILSALAAILPIIATEIANMIPTVITTLIDAFVLVFNSLAEQAPELVPIVVDAILAGLLTLFQNAPALIEAGVALLNGLIVGISNSIPLIIEQAPVIMDALIGALEPLLQGMVDIGASILASLVTGITGNETSVDDIKQYFIGLWDEIQTVWDTYGQPIFGAIESVGAALLEAWQTIWPAAQELVSSAFDTISVAWTSIGQPIFDSIKAIVSDVIGFVGSFFVENFDTMSTTASDVLTTISELVSTVFTAISTYWTETLQPVLVAIGGYLQDTLQPAWDTVFSGIQTIVSNTFDGMIQLWENSLKPILEGIGSFLTGVFTGDFETAFTGISDIVTGAFSGIETATTTAWTNIQTAISTAIEAAKTVVSNAIDAIKEFFDFEFEWPDIPLPHFTVKPKGWQIGDLLKGSIPTLGIDWYAKAMNNPMLLRGATIFGMQDGQLLGGGEAGGEVVAGANTVSQLIYDAVRAAMGSGTGGIVVNQNIYSEAKTAADLMQEARWEAERAVLTGV